MAEAGPFEFAALERATVRATDAADLVTQHVGVALSAVSTDVAELKTAGATAESRLSTLAERINNLEASDDLLLQAVNGLYKEVTRS